MDIISLKFAVSVIAAVFIFYLLKPKYRVAFLTLLSCGFIASYNYYLLGYVLVYALINYYIGLKIPGSSHKIALYRTGVIINISQLVLLKYATFAIDPLFEIFNSSIQVSKLAEVIVPIGISYFTLQGIGYMINLKMGWEKPEKNFLSFLLYIAFFPKFLSGPVERSNHFLPQLKQERSFDSKQVSDGLRIALFGFFKKIAIANQMAPFIIGTYADLNGSGGAALWLLLILQPLYLYFDFSGYTDIAIGFAKTFGIDLLPNFNKPFFAENVTNFWKRFHISLSSWFNDYIFRQTSFRRRKWGVYASTYAVFLTFVLFGIWHGAGWNFMVLGLLQALALNYEFFTKKWRVNLFSRVPVPIKTWFGRIVTYLFYGASLIFFFSPDINATLEYFSHLFDGEGSVIAVALTRIPWSAYVFMLIYMLIELFDNDYNNTFSKLERLWSGENIKNRVFRWAIYFSVMAILFVLGNQVQQFIYVQF